MGTLELKLRDRVLKRAMDIVGGLVGCIISVPIIASGGAGKKEDFLELFHHKGIDAGLAAGIFHQKLLGIRELKEYLNASGVEMRL